MHNRDGRFPKRGPGGPSSWEYEHQSADHAYGDGYYDHHLADYSPRGRGGGRGRPRRGRSGGRDVQHHPESGYMSPPPNQLRSHMPYQARAQPQPQPLAPPNILYATFAAKAQGTMPSLILRSGAASGSSTIAKPCFKYHLMDLLNHQPRKLPQILSKHHQTPDQSFKTQYIDIILQGCTDSRCPWQHDLGNMYIMPQCRAPSGDHLSSTDCPRQPTCVFLHVEDCMPGSTPVHTPSAIMPEFTNIAQYTEWKSTLAGQCTHQPQSAAPWQSAMQHNINAAPSDFVAARVVHLSTPQMPPLATQHEVEPTTAMTTPNAASVMLAELVCKFDLALFEQLGSGSNPDAPISKLTALHPILKVLAKPEFNCTLATAYMTGVLTPPTLTYLSSITTHASNTEMHKLINIFSRGAHTFANVPPMDIDSPILISIINTLKLTGFDPTDNGCKIFIHMYLRVRCVKKYHPTTNVNLLNDYNFEAFYRIRTSHDSPDLQHTTMLDTCQIQALAYLLHCFHTDVVSTNNTHTSHFEAQVATYLKDATNIFGLLDRCLLASISPDYNESPIKMDGRLGKATRGNTVLNRAHGLYTNYTGMKSRSCIQISDTSATVMEPGWLGFCYPPAIPVIDKYGFCSYVLFSVYVLGTKPNEKHSSSSHFCVDRINNRLHYTIDNIRFTDNSTNFTNKQFASDEGKLKSEYQNQITLRWMHKIHKQNAKILQLLHSQ